MQRESGSYLPCQDGAGRTKSTILYYTHTSCGHRRHGFSPIPELCCTRETHITIRAKFAMTAAPNYAPRFMLTAIGIYAATYQKQAARSAVLFSQQAIRWHSYRLPLLISSETGSARSGRRYGKSTIRAYGHSGGF